MDRQQRRAAVLLLLAALLAVGMARQTPPAAGPSPERPAEAERQVLRDQFAARYSEGACSAVYADLTHDGREELVVLELFPDRQGTPIQLHSGPVDPARFNGGRVTVLERSGDSVRERYSRAWDGALEGGVYLQRLEGKICLLLEDGEGTRLLDLGPAGDLADHPPPTEPPVPLLVRKDGGLQLLDELFTVW